MDQKTKDDLNTNLPQVVDERLVCFLYILMRDELVPGAVERIMRDHVPIGPTEPCSFSNKHLEAYARELAARLGIKAAS